MHWAVKVGLGVGALGAVAVGARMVMQPRTDTGSALGPKDAPGGGLPASLAGGGKGMPMPGGKGGTGWKEADAMLGGLLQFGRSAAETSAQVAADKQNQQNFQKAVNGGIKMLAETFG